MQKWLQYALILCSMLIENPLRRSYAPAVFLILIYGIKKYFFTTVKCETTFVCMIITMLSCKMIIWNEGVLKNIYAVSCIVWLRDDNFLKIFCSIIIMIRSWWVKFACKNLSTNEETIFWLWSVPLKSCASYFYNLCTPLNKSMYAHR